MDDVKPTSSDDEFHFSEAEETDSFSSVDETGVVEKKSAINRRNLLLAIGVIIVALSVYKLIGVFFGASGTKKKTTTTVTTQTRRTPIRVRKTLTKPIGRQRQVRTTSVVAVSPTGLQRQLEQMTQHDVQSSQKVDSIGNNLTSLSSSVSSLQDTISSINQQLQTISAQLEQQHAAINALRPKKVKRRRLRRRARIPSRPRWYIQAILPGRAWLFQDNGANITVSVGDALSGYGSIRNISIPKGVVKTSSGVILRYRGL